MTSLGASDARYKPVASVLLTMLPSQGSRAATRRGMPFMASLQQRSGWFHLLFRFDGRQFSHALKTRDRREADAIRGTVDRVLIRVRNKEIPPPPPDADVTAYLLAGGKVVDETRSATPVLTLRELSDRYIQTHGNGALEPKTLVMLRIHFTHLIRHFGERKAVAQFTTGLLQEYVTARCQMKGKQQRPISPVEPKTGCEPEAERVLLRPENRLVRCS